MRFFLIFLIVVLSFTACKTASAPQQASPNAKRYTLKGKIISVDKAAKKAKIQHEAIEGLDMVGMTMDFPVHADMIWSDLVPGSEIRADLVVDNAGKDPYWIENVIISAAPKPGQADLPINDNFAQVGKEVPNFSLVNQDGKKFLTNEYRGKALAVTFIYAQCPLPDYCTRMSTNFSDLAVKLSQDDALKDKIRLLTISFDPARDTPEKLKQYGLGYMGKGVTSLGVWQLAVGSDEEVRKIADFFGLQYEVDPNDKTKINHSLVTAVISPDGRVRKIFKGNEWTPDDLMAELVGADMQ